MAAQERRARSVPDQSVGHGPQRSMTDSLQGRPSAPWQVLPLRRSDKEEVNGAAVLSA
jgi:hypothetical protein